MPAAADVDVLAVVDTVGIVGIVDMVGIVDAAALLGAGATEGDAATVPAVCREADGGGARSAVPAPPMARAPALTGCEREGDVAMGCGLHATDAIAAITPKLGLSPARICNLVHRSGPTESVRTPDRQVGALICPDLGIRLRLRGLRQFSSGALSERDAHHIVDFARCQRVRYGDRKALV
jgi:hypothetical protein